MRTQTEAAEPTASFLHDVTIDHGPAELLASIFLRCENVLRSSGVHLSLAPLDELAAINSANRANWLPLFPIYDTAYWGEAPESTFCFVGRDRDGRALTTVAARIYEWPSSTFRDEALSLRLFYRDPAASRRPDERCEVTAEASRRISGRVVVLGGFWVRPDWRGGLVIPQMIGAISQAYAIARWDVETCVILMSETVYQRGLAAKCGWRNVDRSVRLHNSPLGNLDLVFIWLDRNELLSNFERVLVDLGTQVGEGIVGHDPQQNILP